MPSFMLQPVVENAYSHGLKSREEGGRILLRAWMQGKVLVLTVADNGRGMTAEELDAVKTKIAQSEQTGRSIGLGNISRRIGMLYPGGKCRYTAAQTAVLWCGLSSRRRSSRKKRRRRFREVQIAGGRG